MPFNGTIIVSQNPVTDWERYSLTLNPSVDENAIGFRSLRKEERAEGGYWRFRFRLYGNREFLSDFIRNGLGRHIEVFEPGGRKIWEGFNYEMRLDTGSAVLRASLETLANKVWARYRITGAGETSRSDVQQDTDSQAKYGIKSFVLGCGELESAAVANQVAKQYLDLYKSPKPTPISIRIGKGLLSEPYIEIQCRGYIETLLWRVYNNTGAAASQGASVQVADILGDREVIEIAYPAVWDQTFDEEITDFDAISPATWSQEADGEEGDETDWDAVVEAGTGTLDVAAGAKKNGAFGWAVTVDGGANYAYGSLGGPAAETELTIEFQFDPNSITMATGDLFKIMMAEVASFYIPLSLYYTGSAYQLVCEVREDGGTYPNTGMYTITDAWHLIRVVWKASTGAGNDDGYLYLFVDGILAGSATGLDNDTITIGDIGFGGVANIDAGTSGVMYFDDCRWAPNVGPVDVYDFAAREGTYGLAVFLASEAPRYGALTDPANETEITLECWLHPRTLTMADGDTFLFMEGRGSGAVATSIATTLQKLAGQYEVSIAVYDDGSVLLASEGISISDDWHLIRVVLKVATGVGEDDGMAYLFINNGKVASITEIDNDGYDVDEIRYGVCSGQDSGTQGVIFLDTCRWSDDVVITLTSESGVAQFIADTRLSTNSTLVSKIYDADRRPGDIVSDIARLGDGTNHRWLIRVLDDRELFYKQAVPPERD